MTMGKRIAAVREERGMSQAALAKLVGVAQATIAKLETGHSQGSKHVVEIARALGVTPQWLQSGRGAKASHVQNVTSVEEPITEVPLLSWVAAGGWADTADTHHQNQRDWPKVRVSSMVSEQAFALRIRGDSMEPTFPDGAWIVVDPLVEPRPGKYVIVRMNGSEEVTFKQLVNDGGTVLLRPINPRYPITPMPKEARIVGVVVELSMRFD